MNKNQNIIAFVILIGSMLLPIFSTAAFSDLAPADPQMKIFTHLRDVGIMTPYPDGNLYPEKIMTRAEALTVALKSGGIAIPSDFGGHTYFNDVNPNAWFAPVVARAVELKIVNNRNPHFRPDDAVSKAEFLAFLFRSTQVNFTPFFGRTKDLALDVPEEAWFAPHFAYAKKYQIAHLPADQFYRPMKPLARREVAMMTFRQLRIFHGDEATIKMIQLQAEITQFIGLLRAGKQDKAEFHLQTIVELTDSLTRTRNDKNAVAAMAISNAMDHFSDSLRYFKYGRNLNAIESLHLATKFAERAGEKSEKMQPFARDLSLLIDETLISYTGPTYSEVTMKN